ncbi:hypothetical protein F4820DRAFT_145356 [Hypoxylon rubiginosum]|uniref:Uncharacterized protein n=1 Tax=Hypoxylon rubiginosum TaxID=110542 RepID=A0ACB9ZHJ4_9PEZI|nr:hypothetical protein F4820DRAFT_145356 [Hypoxylon rubiginosum]
MIYHYNLRSKPSSERFEQAQTTMSDDVLPLSNWIWAGTALEKPGQDFDNNDSLQLTSHAVDQLRSAEYNDVRELIEAVPVLPRLIKLKELRENGRKVTPKLKLDRQQKMSAIAAFVTIPQVNTESCQQCKNKKSRGPCSECVAGGGHVFNGACTNCQFSSTASACSFYIAATGKSRKRARKGSSEGDEDGRNFDLTTEILKQRSTAELEIWIGLIKEEIESREFAISRAHLRRA